MLEQVQFYLKHSLNDLRVNRQRTFFALLCIAAGVAAIVSLQTLGVMMENTLTSSLQEANLGDIVVMFNWEEGYIEQGLEEGILEQRPNDEQQTYFGAEGIGIVQTWLDEHYPGSQITYIQNIEWDAGFIMQGVENGNVQAPVRDLVIDADVFPFYGERTSIDGQPLSDLLQSSTDVVLSETLAEALGVGVGDQVRVAGIEADLTVRGLVGDTEERGIDNVLGSILGYYYLDHSVTQYIETSEPIAISLYVRLSDPAQTAAANEALLARFPYFETTTTLDLREQNAQIAGVLNDLVTIMGLLSLLIGGIGIVNTMLVMVSRRTTEVAVLKTLGLEPEKVIWLFMVEALLMGFIGSVAGVLLGWGLAYLTRGYAGRFLVQELAFQVTPQPALNGLIVGVVTTGIFGFLPILAAGQIRPMLVLRPAETLIPRAGRLLSLVALLVMMMALSLVARSVMGDTFMNETLRVMAAVNGVIFGVVIGVSMLAGGITASFTRHNLPLRVLRWGVLLFLLPALGAAFGYFTPTLLLMTVVFIALGLLYVLLWGLIWAVGGGTLAELPLIRRLPARLRYGLLGLLVIIALGVLVLAYLLWGGALGETSPPVLALSLLGIIPLNVMFLPVVMVWGLGKLIQAIGFVDLRIAMRSMLAAKGRAASTLLALVIGVFTLSLITMLVTAVSDLFTALSADLVGGNVVILSMSEENTVAQINTRLAAAPGVRSYTTVARYRVELLYADHADGGRSTFADMAGRADAVNDDPETRFSDRFASISGRGLESNLPDIGIASGRQLTPADAGQRRMVIEANEVTEAAGIGVGDRLTFALLGDAETAGSDSPTLTFEIVGMTRSDSGVVSVVNAGNYAPLDAFPPEAMPNEVLAVADVEEGQIRNLRREMKAVPGAYMLETRIFNEVINNILAQFTAFPTLVAGLALLTGGIVIANSVALSTMERRREIGIMKAIGLQRERVLGMLLLENALTGFIGGLIGVGIGVVMLLAVFIGVFRGELGTGVPVVTALLLMALCIGISLLASVLSVWGASGEKPLNVLRYE